MTRSWCDHCHRWLSEAEEHHHRDAGHKLKNLLDAEAEEFCNPDW